MRNILQWNAEFARNIWLELSLQRLIVAPVILVLVSAVVFTSFDNEQSIPIIHYMSLIVFGIFGTIWGLKNAADSVIDEYNDKTWDWQRMSVIGPWKLAWGKLFGSTVYNWYIALLCLGIFLVTAMAMDEPGKQLKIGLISVLAMTTIHGLMILFSLLMLRRGDGRTRIRSNRIFILGIFLVLIVYRPISSGFFWGSGFFDISWYGLVNGALDIAILNGLFYCGWVIAGLYRSMRTELQFTDKPVWWVTFIVTSFLFQYGYVANSATLEFSEGLILTLGGMFFQTLGLVYLLALIEQRDVVNFRLLHNTFAKRDFNTFFRNIPLWLTTLPIAFTFGILAVLFILIDGPDSITTGFLSEFDIPSKAVFILIAIFGFVIRDLGILLLLSFSSRHRRAGGAMLIYLLVLYVLLPALTYKLGFGAIFYPDPRINSLLMIFFPLAEAGVVLYFLWDRWRSLSANQAA